MKYTQLKLTLTSPKSREVLRHLLPLKHAETGLEHRDYIYLVLPHVVMQYLERSIHHYE
jgi:hypothetical protein